MKTFLALRSMLFVFLIPGVSRFGESYRAYRRAVPRWGFTAHPFQ
jgi:predicted double-glycine peptidase